MNNNSSHNPYALWRGHCWCRHVQICVTGHEPLDDIEEWLFIVLERLKKSLNGVNTLIIYFFDNYIFHANLYIEEA